MIEKPIKNLMIFFLPILLAVFSFMLATLLIQEPNSLSIRLFISLSILVIYLLFWLLYEFFKYTKTKNSLTEKDSELTQTASIKKEMELQQIFHEKELKSREVIIEKERELYYLKTQKEMELGYLKAELRDKTAQMEVAFLKDFHAKEINLMDSRLIAERELRERRTEIENELRFSRENDLKILRDNERELQLLRDQDINRLLEKTREVTSFLLDLTKQIGSGIQQFQEPELKEEMPVSWMGIYLKYKILHVKDFGELVYRIQNIFNILYAVKIAILREDIQDDTYLDFSSRIETAFKLNPEDRLLISSIHTGNSIIIKFRTGWKPSIDTKKGDIILYLPHGVATIVLMAILINQSFQLGITNYEKILNLTKTKNEIIIQEKEFEKLGLEIRELQNRLASVPDSVKNDLQRQLEILHDLTMRNENILQVKIEKDKNIEILEKDMPITVEKSLPR